MWDPTIYLRYGDERSRPFHELVARIPADRPRSVVDLGCGPGRLTATLADRWPTSRIIGLDADSAMIEQAGILDAPIEFGLADIRDWVGGPLVDVVVCSAALQWVPGHDSLLLRWVGELPAGAWLAVQVPGNFDAGSHRALREVAGQGPWRDELSGLPRSAPVRDAAGYAALLAGVGCSVDAWETTYVHLLPVRADADHPVLAWMEGTALRPVRAVLDDARWADFRAALGDRLAEVYPVRHRQVYFPFRRIFFVARTAVRDDG